MSAKLGAITRPETVVAQRPRRVLARGAAAEVLAREQDCRAAGSAAGSARNPGLSGALRVVHARLAVIEIAPLVEQVRAEARALDRLQELLRDDRVGVDVGAVERRDQPSWRTNFSMCYLADFLWILSPSVSMSLPRPCIVLQPLRNATNTASTTERDHARTVIGTPRTSTKCPAIAAAAAIAGLTRCVRPPGALAAFEVAVRRRRAALARPSWSSFMPRHIEQPGSRHSKPASVKTLSRPSFSACSFTRPEPGTTSASLMLAATCLPLHDLRRRAQVLDARVGARADEDLVELDVGDRRIGLRGPCNCSARSIHSRLTRILFLRRIGHAAVDRRDHLRGGAPGHLRLDVRGARA